MIDTSELDRTAVEPWAALPTGIPKQRSVVPRVADIGRRDE